MFNFLGTIAEYFLDLNRERTMEGLKAALARGRKGGRPRLLKDGDLAVARAMLNDGTIPIAEIARRVAVSRTTFYAYSPGSRSRVVFGAASKAECPRRPARKDHSV
jgi:DNA invertase Pin-like site-specific DNA recombinase